ncbi:MAG: hypothetical protein ABW020_09535, partial [Candidatus Rokuibacteriota bacterium]
MPAGHFRLERRDESLQLPGAGSPVLTVCTSRIVRVSVGASPPAEASFVGPRTWAPAAFDLADGEPARISTGDLRIEVASDPMRLTFAGATGEWLLREPPDGGTTVERAGAGGARVRARFTFSGEQHFYGLGQGGGRLERLGQTRQLWNSHLGHGPGSDIGIPLLVSSRGWALFFDCAADATIAVGRSDDGVRIDCTAAAGGLTWYVLV